MMPRIYEPIPETHGREQHLAIALEVAEMNGWIDGDWPCDEWFAYSPYDVQAETNDDGLKTIALFETFRVVYENGDKSLLHTDLDRCIVTFEFAELLKLRTAGAF